MNALIAERIKWTQKQKDLWKEIHRTGRNRSEEMSAISKRIGECTHEINSNIAVLARCKQTHVVMKIANDYLNGEIQRVKKIIGKWSDYVAIVKSGRGTFINDDGTKTTSPKVGIDYLNAKQKTLDRLVGWKNSISKHVG